MPEEGISGSARRCPTSSRRSTPGRAIVRTLVPLLLAQLALLAITVLALVANAAVEQRRPEVALARLRGRSREGGSRVVMAELSLTVLLGVPLGVGVALLIGELLRRTLMPAGVPLELRWPLLIAVGVAVVGCLVAVYLAARPVLREPVASPPAPGTAGHRARASACSTSSSWSWRCSPSWGWSPATSRGPRPCSCRCCSPWPSGCSGPPCCVGSPPAPAAVPCREGGWRRASRRSRSRGARRCATSWSSSPRPPPWRPSPSTRWSSAPQNRTARAELETGAPAVIEIDATNPATLAAVVDALPAAQRRVATPVVVIRPRDRVGGADPARAPGRAEPHRVCRARPPRSPHPARGAERRARRRDDHRHPVLGADRRSAPARSPPARRRRRRPASRVVTCRWRRSRSQVGITVTTPDGKSLDRDLGEVAQTAKGRVPIDAKVLCPDGCRLAGLWLRGTDQFTDLIAGHLDLADLELDGAPLDIGDGATGCRSRPRRRTAPRSCPGRATTSASSSPTPGAGCSPAGATCPTPCPSCSPARRRPTRTGDDFTLVGLGGRPVASRAVQHVDALPALTDHGALADLDAQLRVGGDAGPGSALQVWLGTESPAVIREVSAALTAAGLPVTSTHHGHRGPRPVRPVGHRLGPAARGVHRARWRCSCRAWSSGWSRSPRGAGSPATSPASSSPAPRGPCSGRRCAASSSPPWWPGCCSEPCAASPAPCWPCHCSRCSTGPRPCRCPTSRRRGSRSVPRRSSALLLVGGVALLAARGVVRRAVPERLRESL